MFTLAVKKQYLHTQLQQKLPLRRLTRPLRRQLHQRTLKPRLRQHMPGIQAFNRVIEELEIRPAGVPGNLSYERFGQTWAAADHNLVQNGLRLDRMGRHL